MVWKDKKEFTKEVKENYTAFNKKITVYYQYGK